MIISASRRTDIPAFYTEWFLNRIRAGYCTVPNPFNKSQVARVSLRPEDVDVIVFWTRNPVPLIPHLNELDQRGYRYYFQYTVLGYSRLIDTRTPSLDTALTAFKKLAGKVGSGRVIWRYDPMLFSSITDIAYHIEKFAKLSNSLRGFTQRCVISIADSYQRADQRLQKITRQGFRLNRADELPIAEFKNMMHAIVQSARENNMEITSCAERINLKKYGVLPGKCIDDDLIKSQFGISLSVKKDTSQRKECGCIVSKDIGVYNTCMFGCLYCYATNSFKKARKNFESHSPASPSLTGWLKANTGN